MCDGAGGFDCCDTVDVSPDIPSDIQSDIPADIPPAVPDDVPENIPEEFNDNADMNNIDTSDMKIPEDIYGETGNPVENVSDIPVPDTIPEDTEKQPVESDTSRIQNELTNEAEADIKPDTAEVKPELTAETVPDTADVGTGSVNSEASSYDKLYDYMTSHNYGQQDYNEYSQDPEWQELNNQFRVDQGKDPIDYGPSGEEKYLDDTSNQLTEVWGIPEGSPEYKAIMENEQNGYEEIHSENQEINSYDVTNEEITDGAAADVPSFEDHVAEDNVDVTNPYSYEQPSSADEWEEAMADVPSFEEHVAEDNVDVTNPYSYDQPASADEWEEAMADVPSFEEHVAEDNVDVTNPYSYEQPVSADASEEVITDTPEQFNNDAAYYAEIAENKFNEFQNSSDYVSDSDGGFCGFPTEQTLNGSDYFVQGNNFSDYMEAYNAPDNHPFEAYETPVTETVSPADIEGIHIGENEFNNPDIFWSQHMSDGNEQSFLNIASQIPDVRTQLDSGADIHTLMQDPIYGDCASIYFSETGMPRVVDCGNYYEFDSNGRHRLLAARTLGYDVPVKIIGTRK